MMAERIREVGTAPSAEVEPDGTHPRCAGGAKCERLDALKDIAERSVTRTVQAYCDRCRTIVRIVRGKNQRG